MLVDDNSDNITTFKTALEDGGFSVDAFSDPYKAIEKYASSPEIAYDLLLIDLKYDNYGIDGFQLYQKIKASRSGKSLPHVCFVTAYQDYYDSLKASYPELATRCFIRKPIRMVDLLTRVKLELQES
jgi:CheY-like chemotaxis protein